MFKYKKYEYFITFEYFEGLFVCINVKDNCARDKEGYLSQEDRTQLIIFSSGGVS
jgi:hypothetical protein